MNILLVTLKCELKFEKTTSLLSENSRDNLEQMKKEIAGIKEKLGTLINRHLPEEKKLSMEGKINFLVGAWETVGQLLWFSLG